MRKNLHIILTIFFTFFSFQNLNAGEGDKLTAIELIQLSELALKELSKNDDIVNLDQYISNSRGILIFPNVYEGGLIFGAKGGNGLLLIRTSESEFSGPYFYTLGGLSVGFQLGVKSGKVAMTIMTNRGLKSILKERIKFGVDIDAAVANEGVGFSAESTLRLADVYSFSDNSGLFFGGSLEGSYLQPRNDLNQAIHGKEFSASEIIKNKSLHDKASNLVTIISRIEDDSKKQ